MIPRDLAAAKPSAVPKTAKMIVAPNAMVKDRHQFGDARIAMVLGHEIVDGERFADLLGNGQTPVECRQRVLIDKLHFRA